MAKPETSSGFFDRQIPGVEIDPQFNVFDRKEFNNQPCDYNKRDFFKITLILNSSIRFDYADKGILIDRPALLFSNPLIPYSWELISENQEGYFCLFSEEFLQGKERDVILQESPLFRIGANPVFFLSDDQVSYISRIFENMLREFRTDYAHKHDLLRNHVHLIIHEALKMQPSDAYYKHNNASERIAKLFVDLLDRQFQIDSPKQKLQLKTAAQFAEHLSVHINHLNRAVKEVTGKTTSEHIRERILSQAKALLKQTHWTVNEIAYSLGFEYPTYFHNFFKKQTGNTPTSYR